MKCLCNAYFFFTDAAPPVHSSFVPSLQEMPPQSYPMPTGLDSSLLVPQVSPQLHFVQPPPPPVPVQLQEQVPCSFEAPVVANLPLVAIDSGFADTNAPVGSFTAPEFTPTLQEVCFYLLLNFPQLLFFLRSEFKYFNSQLEYFNTQFEYF